MAARSGGLAVLVVDDHPLVRAGIRLTLSRMEEVRLSCEADSLQAALEACRGPSAPDLVLLDLTLPGVTGLAGLDSLRFGYPETPVVIVSAACDPAIVQSALRRGAHGYIPKACGHDSLTGALRFVINGGIYVPREALEARLEPAPAAEPATHALTARQTDVLRLLMDGKSNKQICRDMNLALGTVKGHVAAILNALNVNRDSFFRNFRCQCQCRQSVSNKVYP
ncbi:MAG: response regulator transcription factor [Burkholderiaceae bacterium]